MKSKSNYAKGYAFGALLGAGFGLSIGLFEVTLASIPLGFLLPIIVGNKLQTLISSTSAGLILGLIVGPSLMWGYDRIPTKYAITKGIILTLEVYAFIEGTNILLFHLQDAVQHLINVLPFDIPVFCVLGSILGYAYGKLDRQGVGKLKEAQINVVEDVEKNETGEFTPSGGRKKRTILKLELSAAFGLGGLLYYWYLSSLGQPSFYFYVAILLVVVALAFLISALFQSPA